ncbi:MAG: hemerythrin family protein [Sulfuricellaceae bacterium]|nr:hemerythrin family protein [Sulfuricellaceae bacterium]
MQKFRLVWDTTRHTTGFEEIDRQHQALVERVNQFSQAVEQHADFSESLRLMNEILSYAKQHFDYEEDLMRDSGFPGAERHTSEHDALMTKIHTLVDTLSSNDSNKMLLVTAFLTDCAENHILHEDQALALYLLAQGVT